LARVEMVRQSDDRSNVRTEECLRLMAAFVALKDRKARATLVKLAEEYAAFESDSLLTFVTDRKNDR